MTAPNNLVARDGKTHIDDVERRQTPFRAAPTAGGVRHEMPNNKWTKIGAAFPHKKGAGFSIELKAFPVDGRLVVLPSDNDRRSEA
jgi:hypothetical protein